MSNIHSECYLLYFKITYSEKHRESKALTFRKKKKEALTHSGTVFPIEFF